MILHYTTPDPFGPYSSFRSILTRVWTRLRPSRTQRQDGWDPATSALIDSFIQFNDTIDELQRLFRTGSVEVPHA